MSESEREESADYALDVAARALARGHALSDGPPDPVPSWSQLARAREWLSRTGRKLEEPERHTAKAAEWLLDNEYLIHRAILQIEEDLPAGFYQQLPALADTNRAHPPRVVAIARGLLEAAHLQLSPSTVDRFIETYQQESPLTTAELWALPTALRLACLEILVSAIERLIPDLAAPFEVPAAGSSILDETECVARALGNLRIIASISWKDFFQRASRVEAILCRDPAAVYAEVDFETADRYRRVVETLARATSHSEIEVADRVVAFADRFSAADPRRSHVGYWLIGSGLPEFERSLGYRVPLSKRWTRTLEENSVALYVGAIVVATLLTLLFPAFYLIESGASPLTWIIGMCVAAIPGSVLGVTLVQWAVTQGVPPHILPKLDFDEGIPSQWKTAVVMPCLVANEQEAARLLESLVGHYLGNPDPAVEFVLLSDFTDADHESMPEDRGILDALTLGVEQLNLRYFGSPVGAFHVLHRPRIYNESEACWMAWERKRGKLEDFNRLVQGSPSSPFSLHAGELERLLGIRFVVTLDSDTTLPRGSVRRLVGILAHPLNRARFDEETSRVVSGYTIVQPRVEIEPVSGNRSRFTRLFAGDTAIDIYSRAVSDVYQDVFGSGIYVGKGIYDVAAFQRSLEGCVPENALASHDLFEGIHGRAALATDVVLYESFPVRYLEFTRRMHRWIRGDWQLLPWLGRTVPAFDGTRRSNRLRLIDRWKILDNLRRSLLAPSLILMLGVGWLVLPGSPWFWTALGVLAPSGHLFTDLVTGFARGRRRSAVRSVMRRFVDHAGRWLLLIVFLPHEAWIAVDAIGRTVTRLFLTKRKLLEWTTAAHTAQQLSASAGRSREWRGMLAGPLVAIALGAGLVTTRPEALVGAFPLLVAWLVSPELAYRLRLEPRDRPQEIDATDRVFLRRLARRTWLFFETFAGPEDQWLPPDNFQEEPGGEIAHRTSPTNIGMLLLSTLTALDLGYLGSRDFASRLANVFDTMKRLERYRGHLLNWYDTRSLEPLAPQYVSTVDSGNLAASLIALKEGCHSRARSSAISGARWDGLVDILGLLEEDLERLGTDKLRHDLTAMLRTLESHAEEARDDPARWQATLHEIAEGEGQEFEDQLLEALATGDLDLDVLRDVRVWLERIHHHLESMEDEIEAFAPWEIHFVGAPDVMSGLVRDLRFLLPLSLPLVDCEAAIAAAGERLSKEPIEEKERAWAEGLRASFARGEANLGQLRRELTQLAELAESESQSMDFAWLYDPQSRLMHIGYNMSADQLDSHHYDLLASEARTASIVAIAKGDVPLEHWFHLGRGLTHVGSRPCLVSWGGSMFEYLMPSLLLRSEHGTLLAQSECAAVEAHQEYGALRSVPWGVSESGFSALDADRNYRYRAFGVPGLGLRRDLADDQVIAPYAAVLALHCDPLGVLANLRDLVGLGMLGEYGFHEAADFTRERIPEGRRMQSVQSYMAHHQGMILASIGNALCDDVLVRRMAADSRIRSVELLLHERVPTERPLERLPRAEHPEPTAERARPLAVDPWLPAGSPGASLHLMGNGRLSSAITDRGAGGLRWQNHSLTRWRPDPTSDGQGFRFYVKDEQDGRQWSAIGQSTSSGLDPGEALFHAHMAEFRRREHGIAIHTEVAVAPGDDVEVRRFTFANESQERRVLTLTSHGEIVLAAEQDDERHPAFSKLFVRSEWVENLAGLLFSRRPRSSDERPPVLLHRLIADSPGVSLLGYEADRSAFVGRGRDVDSPEGRVRSGAASVGFTLDAIASLCVRIELRPNERQQLAFLTLAAGSREAVLEVADRYQTPGALDWLIADAAADAERRLQKLTVDPVRMRVLAELASRVVYPERAGRADPGAFRENRIGQPRLWGMGLSGDLPILLLKASTLEESPLLHDLVVGHRLFREYGLSVDLVVLSEAASGYVEPLRERLLALFATHGEREQLGRRGGVHLLLADQISADDRRLVEVSASAVLDTARGSLEEQLAHYEARPVETPAFVPSRWDSSYESTPVLERQSDLVFDNGIGGFSADGRDYVIHLEPGETTPAPWCNVLANDRFGCLVTESGGGYTWSGNSGENRLTPWTNDPVSDPCGEALYLRDEETGAVWTPTPAPAGRQVAHEITHTAGETRWRSNSEGLAQTLSVFVPPDDPVKLICLQLRNHWDRSRRITATYYAEWVLGTTRAACSSLITPEYDPAHEALLVRNPWNPEFAENVAFLASDVAPHSVTADRFEFLGRGGTMKSPAALSRWGLSGRVEPGGDPCGALQVHLELAPGEERELHFVLGQGRDRRESFGLLDRFRDPAVVAKALEATKHHWDEKLGAVEVHTPDEATNFMLNRWLLYQTIASRMLGRTGFYQSSGAFGFRDQLQDAMCLVHSEPDRLRAHLLECASRQFEEGDVLHWWHPPSGRGVRTRCSDDLLWLPFVTAFYIEATGDESILEEPVPFLAGAPLGSDEPERYALFPQTEEARSLFEHCERALERGVTHGPHELPLIGTGDWNDGMNRVGEKGTGESVWLGWFVISTIRDFATLCERRGELELANHWRARSSEIARAIEIAGWDGAWYRRAIDDEGRTWGSQESEECQIDSIAQSWSVISGGASRERATEAVLAADAALVDDDARLVKLLTPAFNHTLRDPGYIRSYPPGIRENGGQYTHAAAWLGWAFVELGDPDRAARIFELLVPIGHACDRPAAARYLVEPYVLSADIASVPPHVGRGGWTWYTGAAAWTYRLGIEGILGIRRVAGGVRLEPCIPTGWGSAQVRLRGPAGSLEIVIEDQDHLGRGVAEIEVDGTLVDDACVEFPDDGEDRRVIVRLGK